MSDALARAEALCQARGARLTALRRQVLALIWENHEPIGAYALLKRLSAARSTAVPPTVYRALEFLLEQGLVHRIESLNAYFGCAAPETEHSGHFLLCQDCGAAAEMQHPSIDSAIAESAAELGFAIARETVEVTGTCPRCRGGKGDRHGA